MQNVDLDGYEEKAERQERQVPAKARTSRKEPNRGMNGLKQTFWEIRPPLKPAHSRGCRRGRGAGDFARTLHDVRLCDKEMISKLEIRTEREMKNGR